MLSFLLPLAANIVDAVIAKLPDDEKLGEKLIEICLHILAKADRKMKFGKFYGKAKEAKDRLRPGEVRRYDKKLGRYVSNKE